MKQLLILIAALCAMALLMVCAEVDFDNPLDKKSSNYLYGNTDNEEEKIATNDAGLAAIFDSTRRQPGWDCKKEPPNISIVGENPVTIYSNPQGEIRLRELMGSGGWEGVVNRDAGVVTEAKLTRGGGEEVQVPSTGLPSISNYPAQFIIVYTATQTACPDRPVGVAQRGLIINEHRDDDTRLPTIDVRGLANTVVHQNTVYADSGARARDGDGTALTRIDTIKVFRVLENGDLRELPDSPYRNVTDFSVITIPTEDLRRYRVEYIVVSPTNGLVARETRNVEVVTVSDEGLPRPRFVLNTHTHSFSLPGGGTVTFQHPDTAIASYTGRYEEKGLSRVYYVTRDGNEVDIPLSLVTTGARSPAGTVRYSVIASGSNYRAGDTTRNVYEFDSDCDNVVAPSISFTDGAEALQLNASDGVWTTATTGFRVQSNNTAEETNSQMTRRYLVHFGTLNPNQLNVGTHTVTYVGLGQCGGIAVRQRTVTVR